MRPRYCCFYLHQRLHLGWQRAESGGYVQLVLPDGEVVRQQTANMLYCWTGAPAADDSAAVAQLDDFERQFDAQGPRVDALYADMPPGEPVPFERLAQRTLEPEENGWARGLLFAALLADKQRFRFSAGAFTARSAEEVAERIERDQRRATEEAWVAKVARWRKMLEAGEWADDSADGREFLAQLQSLLALERRSPHWALISRPLGLHNLHILDIAQRLKSWLEIAHAWPDWPAIWLQWAEVPPVFAPALQVAAQPLAQAPLRRDKRRDYTAAEAYTIDSEGTQDYDDGFSILEADDEGLTIAMHIAEPDPALEPGHPLFDEAVRRMASVYTLEGIFPMLPESLSTGRFSLVAGADREAVTFVLRIEEAGAHLLEVQRSLVRVTRNLDYGAGQTLLDEQPDTWGHLALLCAGLADIRAAQGAVIMERREVVLDISDPRHIRLSQVVRSGPVYQLVEELAILHNREAGRYCRDHRLPGIYRVQPPPRRSVDGDGSEMHMAARFSTRGGGHAGLACDRYIQTTSPIRRLPDLVMQRQIALHATEGRTSFAERSLLEEWAERADSRLATYDEVTRRIAGDWKRRYLLQHPKRIYEGVARRPRDDMHGRVWLEPLHLLAQAVLPTGVRDGEPVRVRVESVDRDHQAVWVTCVE
ncbi:MAG TPA: RNB domain-containing ribonuclease [bacterium]|nr:RNB domain-containing ribonuclease [bacterium]